MRVAVIGSGLAGLGAARTLKTHGMDVVVFEKADKVGGRLETVRVGEFVFDSGATSIAPFGQALESVILNELPSEGLVTISKPVMAHDGQRAHSVGINAAKTPRYVYSQGIAHLADLLATNLDVRLGANVTEIVATGAGGFSVMGEEFEGLVVAVPTPLAEPLLVTAKENRRFSNVRYRSCISVLLGYDQPFEAPYHALVGPDQTMPLSWLSVETLKCPDRAGEGQTALVAQLSAEYSRRRFTCEDDLVLEETLGDVARLLGKAFKEPKVNHIVRYWYSHPETTATFESVNSPMSRCVIAGDALLGGRTELAFETGVRAARLLLGKK